MCSILDPLMAVESILTPANRLQVDLYVLVGWGDLHTIWESRKGGGGSHTILAFLRKIVDSFVHKHVQ